MADINDNARTAFGQWIDALTLAQQMELANATDLQYGAVLHRIMTEQARAAQIRPGVMRCAKCKFQLNTVSLNMANGTVTAAASVPEGCPNGCGPMWPITWREYAIQGDEALEDLAAQLGEATQELGLLRTAASNLQIALVDAESKMRASDAKARGLQFEIKSLEQILDNYRGARGTTEEMEQAFLDAVGKPAGYTAPLHTQAPITFPTPTADWGTVQFVHMQIKNPDWRWWAPWQPRIVMKTIDLRGKAGSTTITEAVVDGKRVPVSASALDINMDDDAGVWDSSDD